MPRGNPDFAEHGFKKGDGRGGRPRGAQNKATRALKEAIILAAEKSKLAAQKAREAASTANAYAHDEPWQIAGAALAVGVLVGLLLGRR